MYICSSSYVHVYLYGIYLYSSLECVLGEDRFYILTPIDIILAEVCTEDVCVSYSTHRRPRGRRLSRSVL